MGDFFLEVLKQGGLPAVVLFGAAIMIWKQNERHSKIIENYIAAVKDLGEKRADDSKAVFDRLERLTDKFNTTIHEVSKYADTMNNSLEGRLEDIWKLLQEIRKVIPS